MDIPQRVGRGLGKMRKWPDKDSEVFIWVAPDLDYLLIQTDEIKKPGGKPQRLFLQELSMNGMALEAPAGPLTDFSVTTK